MLIALIKESKLDETHKNKTQISLHNERVYSNIVRGVKPKTHEY